MKINTRILAVLFGFAATLTALTTGAAAAPADRYLHVKVQDGSDGESVNVNIPLAMAEKILPAINNDKLHEGRVTVSSGSLNGVDLQTVLAAIHSAPDNEFVTVKQKDEDVRILKENGNIVIKVRDATDKDAEKVDITVPLAVADALFSTAHDNELDVAAAVRALDRAGQTLVVTVESASQYVRIWVDERNSQ